MGNQAIGNQPSGNRASGNARRSGRALLSESARVHSRRLWPSDRPAVQALFQHLDPETRANRFMAAVSDRVAATYAERALFTRGMMFGAFVDGRLRGVAELRPAGSTPGLLLGPRAEAAFVVERGFRREGLGSRLFRRVIEAARSRGVRDLEVHCLHGNGAMRRLALRNGAGLRMAGSETEGAIHLERPTPLSLFSESVAEALDLTLAFAAGAPKAA